MSAARRGGWPAVSVVLPVLNEERHLRAAVRSVLDQDYDGEIQVVLALGPSRDRSDAVAAELASDERVRLVRNPTGRTPTGLNLAIAASSHDIVARVDGHAELPVGYLRTAVELIERTGADNVGGLMSAVGVTDLEQAVARAMTSRLGVGNAPFHVGGAEGPVDTVYLGVFRRSALARVGGFDEAFTRAQDWEMNYRIRSTGGQVWFSPELSVSYRPRGSWRALGRQYFRTGQGRRQVIHEHPDSVTVRYLAPPVAVAGVAAGLVVGAVGTRWALLLPAGYVGLVAVGSFPTGRGLPPRARAALPLVLATMHLAWGSGFLTTRGRGRLS